MQIFPKASLQATCTSYVFLFVSLLDCFSSAAAFSEDSRRDGGGVLLSLRARQLQDPEPPSTTELPTTTTDIAAAKEREAFDISWKSAGKATEARAATSRLRSQINFKATAESTQTAIKRSATGTRVYGPTATAAEAQAQASLDQALANEKQVKEIMAQVDATAFQAAQTTAVSEVAKLEKESHEYFKALEAKFKELEAPGPPTAAQAAAKAAQPYIDVELRVAALVQYYNEKAITELTGAQAMATQAKAIAYQATQEQHYGQVDWAQRHMMQAHLMVATANMKKEGAWNIRKLVESLNMSIPSYQRAAQMAAAHAIATFSGLQMDDKARVEIRRKVSESTQKVEEAYKALEATMAEASKLLEGMEMPTL